MCNYSGIKFAIISSSSGPQTVSGFRRHQSTAPGESACLRSRALRDNSPRSVISCLRAGRSKLFSSILRRSVVSCERRTASSTSWMLCVVCMMLLCGFLVSVVAPALLIKATQTHGFAPRVARFPALHAFPFCALLLLPLPLFGKLFHGIHSSFSSST